MKILYNRDPNFLKDLQQLLESRSQNNNEKIDLEVRNIIHEVKENGDKALFNFSKKFDKVELNESNLLLPKNIRNQYKNKIDLKILKSFEKAITNITNFHQKQLPQDYNLNKKTPTK